MTEVSSDESRQRAAKDHLWMHFTRHSTYDTHDVPTIVRGDGAYIWDSQGRRYLDGLSGLFVVQAGHGRVELAEAGAKQATELVDEEPTQPVEVALALGVIDVGALAAHDDRHVRGVVRRVPREVHPQVVLGGALQVVVVVLHASMVRGPAGEKQANPSLEHVISPESVVGMGA